MDEQLRQLLADLSRSLYEALAESPEVGRKLDQIRQEGYSVYLLLDGNRRDDAMPSNTLAPVTGDREPEFRIDVRDLRFLRSIGIDPTRRLKRRRASRRGGPEAP
jgi:hypothetical protein